jgi:hypothetical protein
MHACFYRPWANRVSHLAKASFFEASGASGTLDA